MHINVANSRKYEIICLYKTLPSQTSISKCVHSEIDKTEYAMHKLFETINHQYNNIYMQFYTQTDSNNVVNSQQYADECTK